MLLNLSLIKHICIYLAPVRIFFSILYLTSIEIIFTIYNFIYIVLITFTITMTYRSKHCKHFLEKFDVTHSYVSCCDQIPSQKFQMSYLYLQALQKLWLSNMKPSNHSAFISSVIVFIVSLIFLSENFGKYRAYS